MGSYIMFDVIPFLMFGIIIVLFIAGIFRGIAQWSKNNASPRLTVDATVTGKRMDVTHHQHANAGDPSGAHGYHTTTTTSYYVTFQVESGDRMEFSVDGRDYGMLFEGDHGKLHFQGTRYQGFERN